LYSSWQGERPASAPGGRRLLQVPNITLPIVTLSPTSGDESSLYPPDVFTMDQLENGAVILHIIGIFYMFAGLAIVCDDYFVPALEVITERLELSDDVAGATFMAAGGSAPELFTSVIGVFIARTNVGFGTIVGSAVFNVLFVIGACAVATIHLANDLAVKEAAGGELQPWYHRGLHLTSWPLLRDSVFYGVDLAVLLIIFLDEKVWWWEALIMLCLYAAYVGFMSQNEKVFEMYEARFGAKVTPNHEVQVKSITSQEDMQRKTSDDHAGLARHGSRNSIKKVAREEVVRIRRESRSPSLSGANGELERRGSSSVRTSNDEEKVKEQQQAPGQVMPSNEQEEDTAEEDEDDDGPWHPKAFFSCETPADYAKYLFFFPLNFPLWATVPNCQNEEMKQYYMPSFVLSILWIAVFSYFMVWWADTTGQVIGIPPEVMGLTLLAAGTSVPDLITSIVVARAGHGDMAVSSSIGSNIFDICFGLPLPWFLYGLTVKKGQDPIDVTSNSLGSSVIMLFGMLIATISLIILFGWRLNIALGASSTLLYLVFMTFTLLIEYEKIDGI